MSSLAHVVAGPAGGPVLVLLHGITGSAFSLADAVDHWAQAGYRVVAVDARGHGLSPRWTDQTVVRAGEVLVDDVVDLLHELRVTRGDSDEGGLPEGVGAGRAPGTSGGAPVLVGHSMGAATAMAVAVRQPGLVAGAVLEDPALYGTRTPEELLARGQERERARAVEVADPVGAVGRALEGLPAAEAVPSVWAAQRTDPALLLSGVVAPPLPWRQALAGLAVPTLLVTGDRPGSARVGPDRLAAAEVVGNPWIETALVAGAGHQVRRDRPEAFYDVVDRWLSGLVRRGVLRPDGPRA